MFFRIIAAFLLTASLSHAQSSQVSLAKDGFAAKLAALESQPDAPQFEVAFLSALRAIEKAAQAQQQERVGFGLNSNPILGFGRRTEVLPPARPEAFRDITVTLLDDLRRTRVALGAIKEPANATFELNVNNIWFDLNQNGVREDSENAVAAMTPILGRRAVRQAAELQSESGADIIIRFDHADIAWLTAYTHMLSAIGETTLAFDPTSIIADLQTNRAALAEVETLPPFYDLSTIRDKIAALEIELKTLKEAQDKLKKERDPLIDARAALHKKLKSEENPVEKAALKEEIAQLNFELNPLTAETRRLSRAERAARAERLSAEALLPSDSIATGMLDDPRLLQFVDGVYVLLEALRQQPKPSHLNAALSHWSAMIAQNKTFWELVALETDDTREWVPNAQQTSAIGFEITQVTADTWQQILREADAVVNGALLIPHPLLPKGTGISLKKYFDTPAPLDLIGWMQGRSAYPYVQRGQSISEQSWQQLQRLSGGNATLFALFLN